MPANELTPPVDNTRDPPMHEMDWQRFERLTVDLFSYEPGVTTSEEYGVPGQTDHGVDVIARRADGEEVASCKRREEIAAKDLVSWSEDFLKHWDSNWGSRSVKRFVLATTARNAGDRHVQNQVTKERERFNRLGVSYELWGPKQFVHKLRPYRALAARYLGEPWSEIICGSASEFGVRTGTSNLMPASAIAQVAERQEMLSGQAASRAEQALIDLRAGRIDAVRALLAELRKENTWSQLMPATQAKILRLAAAVALRNRDLDEAAVLDAQAEALSPAEEARVPAQIALELEGVDAAIARLGPVKSVAGKQLLASLLMMRRDVEALPELMSELIATDSDDPETLRLSALHELLKRNRDAALAQIRRAEAKAGEWRAVLQAGVIIRYAFSLSPAVSADWLLYPNPVVLDLVRGGADVEAHLNEALTLLDRLELTARHPEIRLWRLALLANRRNGHAEASAFAAEILIEEPGDPATVAWCLTRRLDVDLAPSTAALEASYAAGTDLFRARVLGLLLASTLDAAEAASRLRQHLDTQTPQGKAEAERWIRRLEGRPEEPRADDDEWMPEALRRLHETGDCMAAPELLRRAFSTHPPHPGAVILAQAIANLGRWEMLDQWIENILEIDTPAAVRLAAFVASRQGDSALVLTIVDGNAASFGQALPPDLWRLRADALLRLGQVTAAVREAEQIAAATLLPEDRLFRAEILVSVGDLRSGTGAVREALHEDGLPPELALRWAYLLTDEDPDLARQLWRRAVSGGVHDDLVVAAMHQAFQLGLDNEIGQLMPMVQARAVSGAPEIKMLDFDEAVEVITRQRESDEAVEKLYLDGAVPVHMSVRGRLGALVDLYMGQRQGDAGQLLVRPLRHGSRPRSLDFGSWRSWHIHLDVTGLLEASRAKLLDEMERLPNPILVSPRLPILLLELQKAVRTAQPSIIEAKGRVLNALERRAISELDAAPEGSITIGLTAEEGRRDLTALVRALRTGGYLSSAEAEEKFRALGSVPAEDLVLAPGTALHLDGHALEQAAAASLIDTLTGSFIVSVEAGFRDQASRAIAADHEERRLAEALSGLRERLSDGIQIGRYQPLTSRHADDDAEEDLLLGSLRDILGAPSVENGVAWIDDRFLSSYSRLNTMPIVGILDALHAMRGAGVIDDARLSCRIGDLRQSGALFIPFDPEEVSSALLEAPVVGEHVVENDRLKTLRRSLAAAARFERHLKLGETKDNRADRPDEIEYPRSIIRLLPEVLEHIWNAAGQTDGNLFARSDWLWANARFTQTTRDWPNPKATQEAFESMQIAFCLDKAAEIGGWSDERKQLRLTFLHWVWERILRPKLDTDPGLLARLTNFLSHFYGSLPYPPEGRGNGRIDQIPEQLILFRVNALPAPIRELVAQRPEFRAHYKRRVGVGRSWFDHPRFWRAIRAALRYGNSRLRDVDGRRVRMRRDGDDILLSGGVRARLHDPIACVVAASSQALPDALDRMIRSFDVDEDRANELRSGELDRLEPHVLAARLEAERTRSYADKFKKVEENLRRRRSFPGVIFEPVEVGPFLNYLGIPADAEAPDLRAAFVILSERHTPEEAFRRLSGIPVAGAGEFARGAEDPDIFASLACTPVALVHAAAIAQGQHRHDLVLELVDRLIRTIANYGDLIVTILNWTERVFYRDGGWRALSLSLRLASVWAYADRLTSLFITSGSSPDHAKAFFKEHPQSVSVPDLVEIQSHALDQAAPRMLSSPVLLFHCLGAIFGSKKLDEHLPDELIDRARELLSTRLDTRVVPHGTLIIRRAENPDALGSFMRASPNGLLPDELNPATVRKSLIEDALNSLEADGPDAVAAWKPFAAFASGGLSPDEQQRFMKLLRAADLWSVGFESQQPRFIYWRALLAPAAAFDPDWATDKLIDLARACRRNFTIRDENVSKALGELVETASILAAPSYSTDGRITFEDLLRRIAVAWPECVPVLRTIVDNLLAYTPVSRSRQLWELHLLLRTFQ